MIIRLSMTQRYKIGAAFAVFVIVFLGLTSVYQLHLQTVHEESLIQDRLQGIAALNALQQIQDRFQRLEIPTGFILRPDFNQDLQSQLAGIASLTAPINRIGTQTTPSEALLVNSAASLSEVLRQTIPPSLLSQQHSASQAIPLFFPQNRPIQPIIDAFVGALAAYQEDTKKINDSFRSRMRAMRQDTQARIGLLTLATIFFALILGFFFSQQISLPIQRVVDLIQRIRDGQYVNLNIRDQTEDEIGRIFSALLHMVSHIATRDQLKLEKIDLEKRRFEVLGNQIKIPFFMLNRDRQVAFANHACLELFRLAWDDVYEVELTKIAIPPQLKEEIAGGITAQKWNEEKHLELLGENYAFDLTLRLVPVKGHNSETQSVICLLGKMRD